LKIYLIKKPILCLLPEKAIYEFLSRFIFQLSNSGRSAISAQINGEGLTPKEVPLKLKKKNSPHNGRNNILLKNFRK